MEPVDLFYSYAHEDEALREGAFGEAVMPDELLALVTKVLTMG
ncbi:MAG: hypothetical protein OEW25_12245 [Nitrospira sp.]|nr:hypothetical protein [Nitrospira sp.]MDH4327701.1 hypothetical protein [Nitrospira sp.]MDH5254089.1 hypothetical protein [Nitrospira sp.]